MNYKVFEELPCWQKAIELCQAVSQIIGEPGFRRDCTLRDQIWRATGSVMDNIAEGFDDGSTRELIRFLGYSQRSSAKFSLNSIVLWTASTSVRNSSTKPTRLPLSAGSKSKVSGNI